MGTENPYAKAVAATTVRTGSVEILGGVTRYWDYGPAKSRTTIVAVHGFRGEHHGLEPIVAHLKGVRVLSPDLPGFGESTPMTQAHHDVDGYARWLGEFVSAVGPAERPVILGHSFGSIVAAAAVAGGLATPALILINPIASPALKGPKAFVTKLAIFYYWLGARLPKKAGFALLGSSLITRFVTVQLATTHDRGLRRWIHGQHTTYFSRFADRDTLLESFRASTTHNVTEYAHAISVPTLLVAAERDQISTVADERALCALLPHGELHVIPGVGHLIHYERPVDAADIVLKFLEQQASIRPTRQATR